MGERQVARLVAGSKAQDMPLTRRAAEVIENLMAMPRLPLPSQVSSLPSQMDAGALARELSELSKDEFVRLFAEVTVCLSVLGWLDKELGCLAHLMKAVARNDTEEIERYVRADALLRAESEARAA